MVAISKMFLAEQLGIDWPIVDRIFIAVIGLTRFGAGICSFLAPGVAVNGCNEANRSALFGNCSTRYQK